MKGDRFNTLVEERIAKINDTLVKKAKEYANDNDRLHNFNKAGVRSDQSREKALLGMLLKHEVSIDDIVEALDYNKLPTREMLDEKIGDIINYYILLEACIVERLDNQGNTM